jgi:ribosomal protein L37E
METMQVTPDGVVEVLSPFHWWCRRCGRWTEVDDDDLCAECSWMVLGERSAKGEQQET